MLSSQIRPQLFKRLHQMEGVCSRSEMKFLKLGVIFLPLILNCVLQVEMIAKEYLNSLTDPEKEDEDIPAETPGKETGVGLSVQFNSTIICLFSGGINACYETTHAFCLNPRDKFKAPKQTAMLKTQERERRETKRPRQRPVCANHAG